MNHYIFKVSEIWFQIEDEWQGQEKLINAICFDKAGYTHAVLYIRTKKYFSKVFFKVKKGKGTSTVASSKDKNIVWQNARLQRNVMLSLFQIGNLYNQAVFLKIWIINTHNFFKSHYYNKQ